MRKSQQKQIQDMLAMFDKAHGAIKKAIETGNCHSWDADPDCDAQKAEILVKLQNVKIIYGEK